LDLGLSGRSALITGASRGIGYAVARTLAQEGCSTLHLTARDVDELAANARKLEAETGVTCVVHAVDIGERGAAKRLGQLCSDVDILVNNAGAIPRGNILDIDEDAWREAWDVKVFGYVNLTREIYRAMVARGSGVICNVVGSAGEAPNSDYIAAGSGNAALIYFTEALGGASLEHGVRVLGVNPGATLTERHIKGARIRATARYGDPERYADTFEELPRKRPAHPEEVGSLVAYLVSDHAAYISGTLVLIDGGMNARARRPLKPANAPAHA
jgi:NAD(P)-dependent dehydrogenase (short-subunit alcohol dehydrogenase family)